MATSTVEAGGQVRTVRFAQVTFAVMAILAAATGLLLVAVPGSTKRLFAWGLKPVSVAALAGGEFLGLAVLFAIGAARARVASRGLGLMLIVFTVPTLGYTLINKDVFDFGRWQADLWLALFIVTPVLAIVQLVGGGWRSAGRGPLLPVWARAVLWALAVAAGAGATALWVSPTGSGPWLPYVLSQFGGQLVGVWFAVIWFNCLWAAMRPAEEARVFVFGATALLAGALIATVRTFGFLQHSQRAAYAGILVGALILALLGLVGSRARSPSVVQ